MSVGDEEIRTQMWIQDKWYDTRRCPSMRPGDRPGTDSLSPHRNQPASPLNLNLPASRTVRTLTLRQYVSVLYAIQSEALCYIAWAMKTMQ